MSDGREVIAAGAQPPPWYKHLLPVARFLIEERGHLPIERPDRFGFAQQGDGYECHLTHKITAEDWEALNERFVIPSNVNHMFGYLIRDQDNNIDIVGHNEVTDVDGVFPADVWVQRQRVKGYDFGDTPSPA